MSAHIKKPCKVVPYKKFYLKMRKKRVNFVGYMVLSSLTKKKLPLTVCSMKKGTFLKIYSINKSFLPVFLTS